MIHRPVCDCKRLSVSKCQTDRPATHPECILPLSQWQLWLAPALSQTLKGKAVKIMDEWVSRWKPKQTKPQATKPTNEFTEELSQMDTDLCSPSSSCLHRWFAYLTKGWFCFWGWRNILSRQTHTGCSFSLIRHHILWLNLSCWLTFPSNFWQLNDKRVIQQFSSSGTCSKMWHCVTPQVNRSKESICKEHLFDRNLSHHIWSHPLHVVQKRKIYPNWGHEKCILIESHNSHTQNEVMWFVMI